MSGPHFPDPLDVPVQHARSGATYRLVRLDALPETPEHLAQITRANNEPAIHRWLWRDRLQGQPYAPEKAVEFLRWARGGWAHGTHFTFALLAPGGEVAAALDIKSADLDAAEVGYWLSAAHSGVMTNAVLALADVARAAGYRALFARVREGNARSEGVLTRAGFARVGGHEEVLGHPHGRFTRAL